MGESMYPSCGMCGGEGTLLPVDLGQDADVGVVYRCTNPACNVKFDRHGYSRFDRDSQCWVLVEQS